MTNAAVVAVPVELLDRIANSLGECASTIDRLLKLGGSDPDKWVPIRARYIAEDLQRVREGKPTLGADDMQMGIA